MNLDKKHLAGLLFFLAILVTYHWYYAHYMKGQFIIELVIAFVALYVISIGCLLGKIRLK